MSNDRRSSRATPPPLPALRRGPAGTGAPASQSSANITMPLDQRDILAALDDELDDRAPLPGVAPVAPASGS